MLNTTRKLLPYNQTTKIFSTHAIFQLYIYSHDYHYRVLIFANSQHYRFGQACEAQFWKQYT